MRGSRFTQPARSEALPTLGSSQPLSLPSASTLGPSELLSCFGVGATRLQARPQLLKVGAGSGGVDAPLSLAATVPSRAFAAMSASALGGASGSSVLTGSKTTVTKASAAVARLQAATQRVVLQAALHVDGGRGIAAGNTTVVPVKVPTALTGSVRADYEAQASAAARLAASRAAANAAARTHAREAALRRAAEGLLGGGGSGAGTLTASGSGGVLVASATKRVAT